MVFSTIDDVVAPTDAAPGQPFNVLMHARRKGKTVDVKRTFFSSSGCMPQVQGGQRQPAEGSRASLRPTAAAKAALGGTSARVADNVITSDVSVVSWSTECPMPFEARKADSGWLPGPVNGSAGRPPTPFTGRSMGVSDHTLGPTSSARQIMRKGALSTPLLPGGDQWYPCTRAGPLCATYSA